MIALLNLIAVITCTISAIYQYRMNVKDKVCSKFAFRLGFTITILFGIANLICFIFNAIQHN